MKSYKMKLEPSFEKAGDVNRSRDAIVYISKRIAPGMLEEFQIKVSQPETLFIGVFCYTSAKTLTTGTKRPYPWASPPAS